MWTCTVLYHLLYLLVPGDHLTTPNGITYHMYHAVFDVSAPRGRLVGFIDHTAGPLLGTCCLSHRILYIVVCYRFPYGRLCYRRCVGQNLPIRDGSRISSRYERVHFGGHSRFRGVPCFEPGVNALNSLAALDHDCLNLYVNSTY